MFSNANIYTNQSMTSSNTFDSVLLPMAMKISAQTIGNQLVSVNPMSSPGMSGEEYERISREIKEENINNKIESLIENKEYVEKKKEDHPDWTPNGSGLLFYMDFTYTK